MGTSEVSRPTCGEAEGTNASLERLRRAIARSEAALARLREVEARATYAVAQARALRMGRTSPAPWSPGRDREPDGGTTGGGR